MPPPRIPISSLLARLRVQRSATPFSLPRMHSHNRRLTTFGWAVRLTQGFLTLHVFTRYFYGFGAIQGISMLPTIPHSHRRSPYILTSYFYRHGRGVQVGDVVTFKNPVVEGTTACKRVVGMPGDFVCVVTPGKSFLEEEEEEEEEGDAGVFATFREEMVRVPEGHCWLVGDNLEWSRDSRMFGPVPLNLVTGKVLAVCWPWKDAKWLDRGGLKDAVGEGEYEWVSTR
ncbi:LexA/Signal peptidase [Lophiostoma macrostomum CBS 122681]|uniref:Mitochondrial inner membrane protease subunit n=1 Tax=Lophiostoma macrostomum CBS 122681 TaxID=1314788 RepID=A0A6A6SLL9_9PLEO|nr:LexA/Signal peptidase [Lophiostoma macrostomum CBS 122681]